MNKLVQRKEDAHRGSALIVAILMMMTFGLLALNMVNHYLNTALSLTRSEKSYWMSWELAVSSLNWGVNRRWKLLPGSGWQCAEAQETGNQRKRGEGYPVLRSCFRLADVSGHYVIRGGGHSISGEEPFFLYQLATFKHININEIRFAAIKNGWLDFCPLKDEAKCSEKEPEDAPAERIEFT